ncbi:MAG: hypothetical protein E7496_10145 [Ruminococcus sp.]|nr:hypothetical protein [Ruminococcus sp.]
MLAERLTVFEKQFQNEFFKQSNGKFQLQTRRFNNDGIGGYWHIFSVPQNSAWANIYFHFEVLWSESEYLCDAKKIDVEAHIDQWPGSKKNKNGSINIINENLTQDFINNGFHPQGRNGVLSRETIKADFSDFSKSIYTINHILEILNSDPFEKCRKIADNFKP